MLSKNLVYKSHGILSRTKRVVLSIPTEWNDFSASQALYLPDLYLGRLVDERTLDIMCGLDSDTCDKFDQIQKLAILEDFKNSFRSIPLRYDSFFIKLHGGLSSPDKGLLNRSIRDLVLALHYKRDIIESSADGNRIGLFLEKAIE